MEKFTEILNNIKEFFLQAFSAIKDSGNFEESYTAIARWIFIFLGIYILLRAIISLLKSKNVSEVWGYFNIDGEKNIPLTHWENLIGRSKSSDIVIDDNLVSRNQGILSLVDDNIWKYTDLGSKNGASINGESLGRVAQKNIYPGDELRLGASTCRIFPISLEEKINNQSMRKMDTVVKSPWSMVVALTIFQIMTIFQLKFALGDNYSPAITISFIGILVIMWSYIIYFRIKGRKGFEMEIIGFFLSTLSLAVTASKFYGGVLKQFVALSMGVILFLVMCSILKDLQLSKGLKRYLYIGSMILFGFNLIFGKAIFGAANWISIGGVSFQPSEIIKLAYIWVGAASLDELMEKKNSLIFTVFSVFCFICLALMGDFGTALIFFVTFLVISFLRSGDFTKLILIVGIAFVGGLLVLKFKSYVARRFALWGHSWDYADTAGFQQTRAMSATASGGLVGVGAGGGWFKDIPASETDLVFAFLSEEWGLIMAIMAVLAIITLTIFAVRSIWAGRSSFYTIAACSAMSLFIFQTMLNVFGALDIFPFTGVTFPFLSNGGSSMIASWGMLAFLKAADTRHSATFVNDEEDE